MFGLRITDRLASSWPALLIAVCGVGSGCGPTERPVVPPPAAAHVDLFQDDRGRLVQETWESHVVRGAKVGYRQTRIYELPAAAPAGDGPELRIVAMDRLEMKRFGSVVQHELLTASLETAAGQVRQWGYRLSSGDALDHWTVMEQAEGIVRDGQLELTRTHGNALQLRRYVWPADNQGLFAVEQSLRRRPMAPGGQRTVAAFLPLVERAARIQLSAIAWEAVTTTGEQKRLLRIEATDQAGAPAGWDWKGPTVYWTDEQGQVIQMKESLLDRQTFRVSQAEATRPNDFARLDVGSDIGVRVGLNVADPFATTCAVYRVQVNELRPEAVFPDCLTQQLRRSADQSALLTVRQVLPDVPAQLDQPQSAPTDDDLLPNALITSDDPRVVNIARAAAGSVSDPWRAALALEQYLYRTLDKLDVSQVFGSAAEVAARRGGDCSEHATLLAATCRARRIPARVVIGLVYSTTGQRFLYHMWNEVWIRDRWVPLDATLGRGAVGATHLKLRSSSLAGESAYSLVMPVICLMDRLQIEVVEIR